MLIGSFIAASNDLSYNSFGYLFLLLNNICTCAHNIILKQKLVTKVGNIYRIVNRLPVL